MAHHGHPLGVIGIEMGAGAVFLALMALLSHHGQALQCPRVTRLVAIALACVWLHLAAHFAYVEDSSSRQRVYDAGLTNLEPVYAVLLAMLLGKHHQLDGWFYAGVAVILTAVFAHPRCVRKGRFFQRSDR